VVRVRRGNPRSTEVSGKELDIELEMGCNRNGEEKRDIVEVVLN